MTDDEIREIRAKIHEHMNAGWDMYTATVAANVGKSPEYVTMQEREAIKSLAFADNYGYKGTALMEKLLERSVSKNVTFKIPNYLIQAQEARRSMQLMVSRRCKTHDEPIQIEIHGDEYCQKCLDEKGLIVDG